MKRNNSLQVSLLAAALPFLALAQLPRECFFVNDLHGPNSETAELLSDLPTLMAMYKPGMTLQSISAYLDEFDEFSGIQVNLEQVVQDVFGDTEIID